MTSGPSTTLQIGDASARSGGRVRLRRFSRPRMRLDFFRLAALAVLFGIPPAPSLGQTSSADQALPPVEVKPPAAKAAAKPAPPGKSGGEGSAGPGAISVIVNDQPITAYQIEKRMNFELQSSTEINKYVQQNAAARLGALRKDPKKLNSDFVAFAKSKGAATKEEAMKLQPAFSRMKQEEVVSALRREAQARLKKDVRKNTIDTLINELLQLQEAGRLSIVVSEDDVDAYVKRLAEQNKKTPEEFAAAIKKTGGDIDIMRGRIKSRLAWIEVIRNKYSRQVQISDGDVDRLVAALPEAGEDGVELQVQRISLPLPASSDERSRLDRLREAEAMREKLGGCKTVASIAAASPGAKVEDLGARKPATIPEPTRTLLLAAADGEALPPRFENATVEVWVLCGRSVVKADDKKREAARDQARQEQLGQLAKALLADLRDAAHIVYRE